MISTTKKTDLKRIMIVDDSEMDRFILRHLLGSMDYPVDVVSYESSLEAINDLKEQIIKKEFENLPNVIFLDLDMPGLSGFNFLDLFSSFPKKAIVNCKIIIITSYDDFDNIKKSATYNNVVDFIIKPIHQLESIIINHHK